MVGLDAVDFDIFEVGGHPLQELAEPVEFTALFDDDAVQFVVLALEMSDVRFELFQPF
jgi:hypothetical protein